MNSGDEISHFPDAENAHFKMIDVGRKRPTRRRAVACGSIKMNSKAFELIRSGKLPKGNVLALAEAAGVIGAKKTPEMIPLCHPLPLDQVTIHCRLDKKNLSVTVYAQVAAYAKTGVEMEALAGVNAALLTIWDLTKGVDPDLLIEGTRLLVKTGGKSGVWTNPMGIPKWLAEQLPGEQTLKGRPVGILVLRDQANASPEEDHSGPILNELMTQAGARIEVQALVHDDKEAIEESVTSLCRLHQMDLLVVSGGTGTGPRDVATDVLEQVADRMLRGFGEVLRAERAHFTNIAWLSRMSAGMIGKTLIIVLPESPQVVRECWNILKPSIGEAIEKINSEEFE